MIQLQEVNLANGKSILKTLEELGSRVRFSLRGASMKKDGQGGFEPDPDKPGANVAEVVEIASGEIYARAEGATDELALIAAVTAAITAPKPLTVAQKADPNFTTQAARIKELEDRIAAMESGTNVPPASELTRGQKAAQTRAANKAAAEEPAPT